MKIKINRLKVLSFASLGVLGLAVVSTTVGCNVTTPASTTTNLADLSKQINNHKFTKEEVTLTQDAQGNFEAFKKSISENLKEDFKNKFSDFNKVFSITKISKDSDAKELLSDDIQNLDSSETPVTVSYVLKDLKNPNKSIEGQIIVKISKENQALTYATDSGFSIEKALKLEIIKAIKEKLPLIEKISENHEILNEKVAEIQKTIDNELAARETATKSLEDEIKLPVESFKKITKENKDTVKKPIKEYLEKLHIFITKTLQDSASSEALKTQLLALWNKDSAVKSKEKTLIQKTKEALFKLVTNFDSINDVNSLQKINQLNKRLFTLLKINIINIITPESKAKVATLEKEQKDINYEAKKIETLKQYFENNQAKLDLIKNLLTLKADDQALKNKETIASVIDYETKINELIDIFNDMKNQ